MKNKFLSLAQAAAFLIMGLPCLVLSETIPSLEHLDNAAQAANAAADPETARSLASRIDGVKISPASTTAVNASIEKNKAGAGSRLSTSVSLPFKTAGRYVRAVDDKLIGPADYPRSPWFDMILGPIATATRIAKLVLFSPILLIAGVAGLIVGAGLGVVNLFTGKEGRT